MGWRWAIAAVLLVAPVAGPWSARADAQQLPTVTLASGPTSLRQVPFECSDQPDSANVAREFVVTRNVASPQTLTVRYRVESVIPVARSGVDFAPLSGVVTIPKNAKSAHVQLHPLTSPTISKVGAIGIRLLPAAGYAVGSPPLTLTFIVPCDPSLGPVVCDPSFQIADIPTNREQTIHVGEQPVPIEPIDGRDASMRLIAGALPPGISLRQVADGDDTFAGAATTAGTTAAALQLCAQPMMTTCRKATLVVHVLPGGVAASSAGVTGVAASGTAVAASPMNELPRTGRPLIDEFLLACALLVLGAGVLCKARADAAPDPAHHNRTRVGSRAG